MGLFIILSRQGKGLNNIDTKKPLQGNEAVFNAI
jgi:hypothetical protein